MHGQGRCDARGASHGELGGSQGAPSPSLNPEALQAVAKEPLGPDTKASGQRRPSPHPTPPGRVKGGDCRGTASGEIGGRGGAPRPGREGSDPAVRTERVSAAAPTQVRPSGLRRRRAAPARQLPYPRRLDTGGRQDAWYVTNT